MSLGIGLQIAVLLKTGGGVEMSKLWGITKGEMQKKHILFQEEDRETYIRELLEPTRSMEVSASS